MAPPGHGDPAAAPPSGVEKTIAAYSAKCLACEWRTEELAPVVFDSARVHVLATGHHVSESRTYVLVPK